MPEIGLTNLKLGIFCLFCMLQAQAMPVRLLTQQQPPYSNQQADGRQSGLALETVRCVMNKLQRPVEIKFLPWKRAQNLVELGEADGFFSASQNSERDRFATLSQAIAPQQWRWYFRTESSAKPLSEEFRLSATVGAYFGSNMLTWLKASGYRIYATPPAHDQLLKMLLAGRVAAVLASDLAMNEAIHAEHAEYKIRSELQEDKPLGVYFGHRFLKEEPEFLTRFNAELPSCRIKI
ncbi:amino acid ABC transporter substrate-binding protein (PAAT family) [Iodobacter fluviatilis]|uniref:Amino acid ABC transporter substrate-binding protein (PAAT family) n=2 Tax=Iodobacter fluviatilis TaxID=537 RepID=A0A377STN2_9NEIS|nr:amino acid ABC transporter substrate-binding protein (PAAT family) [Iodobacter fluviatilis]STR44710.1 Bacterial extracellular solute-binding proteins, family 3 [Iodobacter fluviatilis]